MKFSVVIPSRNRSHLVPRAVRSALAGDPQAEVIVVDDCSDPPLQAAALGGPAMLLRNPRQIGPGPSRERGLAVAQGEMAVILDDDDELLPDWRDTLERTLREFPQWRDYPVLHFGSVDSHLDRPFRMVGAEDLFDTTVRRGAFLSVVNLERRAAIAHPPNRIGSEGLLWLRLARQHGIPTWARAVLRWNSDATNRLTSYGSQLRNAADLAWQQRALIEAMPPEYWRDKAPQVYRKRLLGELLYTLLAGIHPAPELRREALGELGGKARALLLLGRSRGLLAAAFYLYRRFG